MRFLLACALFAGLCGGAAVAQNSASAPNAAAMPTCAAGDPVVWVNTSSHVYHMQGSKYYGHTKSGKYTCKSAADSSGAHQAKNETNGKSSSSASSPAASSTAASPAPSHSHKHKSHATPTPAPEAT